MSYNPQFNPKPLTYNPLPAFTSWSQSINSILAPPTIPSFPFANLPIPNFHPFHPPLIHQQNNFFNSNFNITQPHNPRLPSMPAAKSNMLQSQSARIESLVRAKSMLKSNEIIQISDDDDVVQIKPLIAVIKQKASIPGNPSKLSQNKFNQQQQKQVIQKKKEFQYKELIPQNLKKQQRPSKNIAKIDIKEENSYLGKKKKIAKEKFIYRLTQEEQALMKISKYRQYRPDLIMVGPQFQAKITNFHLPSEGLNNQLQKLRENLLMRRHH